MILLDAKSATPAVSSAPDSLVIAGEELSSRLLLGSGGAIQTVLVSGADTARLTLQALGGSLARVVVTARSWSGGVRADAGSRAFLELSLGAGPPRPSHVSRIPGRWWAVYPDA